jgi:TonB family protein
MSRATVLSLMLLAAAVAVPSSAAGGPAEAVPVENLRLMEVEGQVVIGVDGSVVAAEVTTARVTPVLRDALLASARGWKFRPVTVNGVPTVARTGFRVMLAASPDGESYRVRVDGVDFSDRGSKDVVHPDGVAPAITGRRLGPPQYPQALQVQDRTGAVMLAILVGADGRAEDVQVVQSLAHDFRNHGNDKSARRTMRALEANAVGAARHWTFNVPPALASAPPAERTVMVPVVYTIRYDVSQPGYWIPVQRGPRVRVPWLPAERNSGLALGSSSGGTPSPLDSPYRLLTPLAGTTLD